MFLRCEAALPTSGRTDRRGGLSLPDPGSVVGVGHPVGPQGVGPAHPVGCGGPQQADGREGNDAGRKLMGGVYVESFTLLFGKTRESAGDWH